MKKINLVIVVLCVASVALSLYAAFGKSNLKVAYTRSYDLVYNYIGMKEAQNKFDFQKKGWQSNIDTLKMDYQGSLSNYQTLVQDLTAEDKQKKEDLLRVQYENLMRYSESINQKMTEEENKMTQAVLNQINSYAVDYAKRNGYDYVFGTTTSGNILYGKESHDITDALLKELNENYQDE